MERIGIVDPDVGVPGPTFGIHDVIGTHHSRLIELGQHDDDPVAFDHAEGRRVIPETLEMKSKLVPVVVRGLDDIIDDEVGSEAPALLAHGRGGFRNSSRLRARPQTWAGRPLTVATQVSPPTPTPRVSA